MATAPGTPTEMPETTARQHAERLAVGAEEHGGRRAGRRRLAAVIDGDRRGGAVVVQQEAAAADARGLRLDHAQNHLDGDRGIDRRAAAAQHFQPRLDRHGIGRRHHRLRRRVARRAASGLLYVIVAGFLVAAVCGYMAGLMGSSNGPVSRSLAILAVLGAALLLVLLAAKTVGPPGAWSPGHRTPSSSRRNHLLLAVATVANDNLQDLKTGQLVEEPTPWKQQLALVVGVLAGSLVIPPILDVLNKAFGFAGAAQYRHHL